GLPPDRDDDAARRDLSVDRRRQAAAGGRLARQGDGAHLPAGDPNALSLHDALPISDDGREALVARLAEQGRSRFLEQLAKTTPRSEEHTSELQSLAQLVRRLQPETKTQGRTRRLARDRRPHSDRGRARARSRDRVLG